MEGKDNIKELFSQKLGNYEAKVNPELWAKISTQVAAGATTTVATGLSMFAKVAIGLGISAAAITTVVLLTNTPEEAIPEKSTIEVQQETSNIILPEAEKVAEVNELTITEAASDIVKNEDLEKLTTASVFPVISSSQGAGKTETKNQDISISGMTPKSVTAVGGGESGTPTIVDGITYSETTNYGGSTVDTDYEAVVETNKPKSEPIKRFVNVFTPNGQNPEFFLESEGLTDFSVVVFNPDGDIVFKSNDSNFKWDGRDMRTGEMVDSGNYMYMVSAYDSDGNPYPIYERLTIIVN